MNVCYLSMGSNINFPIRRLNQAMKLLSLMPHVEVKKVSSIYRTKPWGYLHQPDFYNLVVKIHTLLPPLHLLKKCQEIEKKLGRVRKIKWGPRTIDIDILLYENLHLNHPKLILPHPRMMERSFVMHPYAEISHTS